MSTKKVTPKLTEVSVSYSCGVKCNLGMNTYESSDAHVSRSERYDVTGVSAKDVEKLVTERYQALKAEVDELVVAEYQENSCFAGTSDDS